MDTEHSCRICRGEATESQPLIHPCKCRGSIKYIHQDCLMEWLNHSNKSTKQCDICNTPYKFRTIYDPNMPKSMPLAEIWRKLTYSVSSKVVKNLSIILYVGCIIHIPLFWKFVSRVFTYALDGKLPLPDSKISHVLLYGTYVNRAANGEYLAGPYASMWDKFEVFFVNTFLSGVVDILLFIVVLFVIFIEHEWVVREEGYTKLLLRNIGKEPRTKLADLLALMLHQGGDNQAARELMINRALEDLQNLPEFLRHEAVLRRALNNGDHNDLLLNVRDREPRDDGLEVGDEDGDDQEQSAVNPHGEMDPSDVNPHGEMNTSEINLTRELGGEATNETAAENFSNVNADNSVFHRVHGNVHEFAGERDDPHGIIGGAGLANRDEQVSHEQHEQPVEEGDDEGSINQQDQLELNLVEEHPQQPELNLNDENEDETPEELERRRNLAEDEMAAVEAANNGDILELLGIRFNLITPIQLMILADFIVLVFLFGVYLIPHFMGEMTAMVILTVCIATYALVVKPVVPFLPVETICLAFTHTWNLAEQKFPVASSVAHFVSEIVIDPILELLIDLGRLDRVKPPTLVERVIFLSIGYSLVCAAVYLLMSTLVAGEKPIMGTARRIFKVLFQIVATAKVFTIFTIEIVIFPIFCGWLLDFCTTPLLVKDLFVETENGRSFVFFFTSIQDFSDVQYFTAVQWLWNPYIRPLLFWVAGTSYMYFIALFVGMVRNHILRPGVLFFIKSPEDPNARLIHDAIVKPFLLQTLRIFLSAKVYTAFIIGGIGSVTWGLRYLVNPPGATGKESTLLPIKFYGFISISQALITLLILIRAKPLIAKFCKMFWTRAFEAMCYKFRLSHFILGNPVAQERGSIVYRSFFHSVLALGDPDYTRPVTYSEALEIFKSDSSVNACFVPDGYYVRAPATDDNSRKFLRGLFVPVSKSDHLLLPAPEVSDDDDTDWWDSDIVYEDTYTVVYQPPQLKLRCVALSSMICALGALLVVVSALVAVLLGRPVTRAVMITLDFMFEKLGNGSPLPSTGIEWSFIDINSLCMGIMLELVILLFIDYTIDSENAINFGGDQPRHFLFPAENIRGGLLKFPLLVITGIAPGMLAAHIHLNYLTAIEKYYFGAATMEVGDESFNLNFTWQGVLLHLAMLPWTLLPLLDPLSLDRITLRYRKATVIRTIGSAGFIALHRLFVYSQQKAGVPLGVGEDIRLRILTLLIIVVTRSVISTGEFLANISEQIKNEKYVTGSAIENIDGDDD